MFAHCWNHRRRPALFSREWLRYWAKRAQTLRSLLGWEARAAVLRRRGAFVAPDAAIAPADIQGDLSRFSLGAGSFVGRVRIQVVAPVRIGCHVCINDGAIILTASHDVRSETWSQVSGPVVLEDFVWVGSGAILLPGVRIGQGAVVGAGAVVTKDIPAFAVAVGNPARILLDRRARTLRYSPVTHLATYRAWCGIREEIG